MYGNDPKLIPRSTYRKNVGEGIRTITYGAHTSLVASDRSGKFVTNVTTAVGHEICLMKCHKLATSMPERFPYLSITVVHLTTGETLLPHKDVQNHRLFRNITTSFRDGRESYRLRKMEYGQIMIQEMRGLCWTQGRPDIKLQWYMGQESLLHIMLLNNFID